jgi:hypothetical protein
MTLPVEADFAVIKVGDGATPEVFTTACGIQNVTINTVANATDRFVRDCAKPGEIPYRKSKTTGKQQDITGNGLTDKASIDTFLAALGVTKNYKIELYADNDTDAGLLLGTFAGAYKMNAANLNIQRDGDSTAEITLASQGAWAWDAAGS